VLYWRKETDSKRPFYYLLAHLAILLMACFVAWPVATNYKAAIVLGLLLTLLAALLHRLLGAPVSVVHAVDLVVLLLYMAAFAALHPPKWPTPWLLLLLVLGGLYCWALLPRLAELGSTCVGYAIVLFLMIWQALEVLVVQPALWTGLALVGALGLALLKALLALDYAYATDRRLRPYQASPGSHWLSASSASVSWGPVVVPPRLVKSAQTLQTRLVQLLEWLKLPALAQKSTPALPLLTLLCHWLLVLSLWGPALVGFAT
jgi:uncharacterized membrane protein YhhN